MFTGIILNSGIVETFEKLEWGARLRIHSAGPDSFERGESVSINGVCLTALPDGAASFFADVSNETLSRTTLGSLGVNTRVNVERALAMGDRLGGHLVQGHVDTVGVLTGIASEGEFAIYRWSFPPEYADLLVSKGSVAVDGVSLTVVDPDDTSFGAAVIPETLRRTNLGAAKIGDRVNLEFDMVAKHVRRLVIPYLSGKPA